MRNLVHSAKNIVHRGGRDNCFALRGYSLRKHHIDAKGFTLIRSQFRGNLVIIKQGFTLIELLVVISIIGVLIGLSFVGFTNARQSARDGKRKTDLESIRSALVLYKSECNGVTGFTPYPGSLPVAGSTFSDCKGNTLIPVTPGDPDLSRLYTYYTPSGNGTFKLCASLEVTPSTSYDVTNCPACGGTGCNYSVVNP